MDALVAITLTPLLATQHRMIMTKVHKILVMPKIEHEKIEKHLSNLNFYKCAICLSRFMAYEV
jgi:hypothetical protein